MPIISQTGTGKPKLIVNLIKYAHKIKHMFELPISLI